MNINRLVHPGFWFGKTDKEEALRLARLGVGGFCLYGGTRTEVSALTQALRAASPHKRILISADYEDGLGRWLPDAELLPSNLALGAAGDENLAFEKGLLTARQAKSIGVDWVFAPVVDLADRADNPIVNTRSFGADPELVIRLAGAFMKGLSQGGALNSLKHFPGHGNTGTDSHLALPVLLSSKEHIWEHELLPFRRLLAQADCVMAGHLLVPSLDAQNPASVSRPILHDLLQQKMGFTGCISTDALCMKALGNEKQAALAALFAGAHVLLVPEKPFELLQFLNSQTLPHPLIARAEQMQNLLCARADEVPPLTQAAAFAPTDFSVRTAHKALTQKGESFRISPGETLYYLSVGNDENLSASPFLRTLEANGVQTEPFQGQPVGKLAILCWRRYQAFKGKIGLDEQEIRQVQQALPLGQESVTVSFANPWSVRGLTCKSLLFTYSPSPVFQQAAAEVLLGIRPATGQLPITL